MYISCCCCCFGEIMIRRNIQVYIRQVHLFRLGRLLHMIFALLKNIGIKIVRYVYLSFKFLIATIRNYLCILALLFSLLLVLRIQLDNWGHNSAEFQILSSQLQQSEIIYVFQHCYLSLLLVVFWQILYNLIIKIILVKCLYNLIIIFFLVNYIYNQIFQFWYVIRVCLRCQFSSQISAGFLSWKLWNLVNIQHQKTTKRLFNFSNQFNLNSLNIV
eukprot:TRINITY_DN4652_c1_g1_i13.p3 TRINITY_DN4652_c1_g1~~TRINITY_DN4652_c1_g1_i13.p3  ORF type:complete len:216 (-),score=-18.43 TRINITY_DN4652_c1_g1_i13:972-1619(-)